MPVIQWEIFLSVPTWEGSVKHSLSFLAAFKSSHSGLNFPEDNWPWWSLCFGICSQVDLCGFSRSCWVWAPTHTSLWRGAEVTSCGTSLWHKRSWPGLQSNLLTEPGECSHLQHQPASHSHASPAYLPGNGQGERDICAEFLEESLNPP